MVKKKIKKVNLNLIRKQIDAVDKSILRSLSKRVDLVIAAGESKKEIGDQSYYKPEREAQRMACLRTHRILLGYHCFRHGYY